MRWDKPRRRVSPLSVDQRARRQRPSMQTQQTLSLRVAAPWPWALFVAACGGDGSSSQAPQVPATGTVRFTGDANACRCDVAEGYTFCADGNALGTASLSAGQSQTYTIDVGQHVFGASVNVTHRSLANVSGSLSGPQHSTISSRVFDSTGLLGTRLARRPEAGCEAGDRVLTTFNTWACRMYEATGDHCESRTESC